jgi:hypothetical protein
MYYSYVEIEYVATSFSPARTDLALKLLREVTLEFGGQLLHGGGNRASNGIGTGALSYFSFVFAKFTSK